MIKAEIRRSDIYEVLGSNLISLYARECADDDLAPPLPDVKAYEQLCITHGLLVYGAYVENRLIGFFSFMPIGNQHYGRLMLVSESFFVHPDYRKTGAGTKLMQSVEKHAKEIGAFAVMISAPTGGKLAAVMKRNKRYKPSNELFIKAIS